jgi:hypothetical protein
MTRHSATAAGLVSLGIASAAPILGCHRSHVYRLIDETSAWFDPALAAIVHRRKSGRIYFLLDELEALVRSRCSATNAESAAA